MGSEGLQELYDYEESLKVYRDWYSIISTAEIAEVTGLSPDEIESCLN